GRATRSPLAQTARCLQRRLRRFPPIARPLAPLIEVATWSRMAAVRSRSKHYHGTSWQSASAGNRCGRLLAAPKTTKVAVFILTPPFTANLLARLCGNLGSRGVLCAEGDC